MQRIIIMLSNYSQPVVRPGMYQSKTFEKSSKSPERAASKLLPEYSSSLVLLAFCILAATLFLALDLYFWCRLSRNLLCRGAEGHVRVRSFLSDENLPCDHPMYLHCTNSLAGRPFATLVVPTFLLLHEMTHGDWSSDCIVDRSYYSRFLNLVRGTVVLIEVVVNYSPEPLVTHVFLTFSSSAD
jgi:hypothetical protein